MRVWKNNTPGKAFPAWGRWRAEDTAFLDTTPFPRGKSKRRGSRGHSLLPMEGGAPKGRRLDGKSGMKESEGDRLKCVVYESTRAPLTRSPFPNGEGCDTRIPLFSTQRLSQGGRQRGGGFAAQKGSQPRLAALGSPFQRKGLAWSLPPSYGRRCPEGAEVGWGKRHERERDCLKCAIIREHPSTANIYGAMPEGLRRADFPFTLF